MTTPLETLRQQVEAATPGPWVGNDYIEDEEPMGVSIVAMIEGQDTPTNGQVTYAWGADDTATPGLYQGEFKVTWGDSTVERFPNKTNFQVQILANLA